MTKRRNTTLGAPYSISFRKLMVNQKGVDGLLHPGGPDAIRQIEGACDFAAEAVDVERNAAHAGIGERSVDLGGDPFIGGKARRLPDPRAAMNQRSGDLTCLSAKSVRYPVVRFGSI